MTASTKPKQSLVGIELVRLLAYEGDRIFTSDRARELAPRVGLKDAYLSEALYHLRKNNWIVSLRRGLYALSPTVPGVAAAHEFEVATALVEPAMISHWSALHYYGLTEQIPRDVFVLTTTDAWVPRPRKDERERAGGGFVVGDTTYRFIQVKPERFFGIEKVWVGDARVSITDPERTLLDGLSMPQYCGDFAEVLHAFGVRMDRLDIERITEYALRMDAATAKRLGWVLSYHGYPYSKIRRLA
jgi:predicted transcriptional regulator of viral defense system